jgi:large subunit ribosomal protein L15
MVVNKRKKFSRQRASHTHGWGSKKKHRGAGNRGGRGMAGTGKRGDQIKTLIWKDKKYFGKHGFKKKGIKKEIRTINIDYIEENLNKFPKQGDIINLKKLGYTKLLGKGNIKTKLNIKVDNASKKAVEKIKKLGGEVILPKKEVKKAEEAPK